MKPRYAIVDVERRDNFERGWHLPYGYGDTIVSSNFESLRNRFEDGGYGTNGYVIERYDNGIREVVYPQ